MIEDSKSLEGHSLVCVKEAGVLVPGTIVYCFCDEGTNGYFWVTTPISIAGVTQFKYTQGYKKYFRILQ
ncbi:MAG TPA: hypothetical protein DCM40_42820 [Maribacter sp.]|nr:hypothetical protein [Maribacter sp.]|tara:strand:+ start:860 stop:1066 length:207 start_codon:yes stop_codon:yes gene_type:complete